MKKKLLFFAGLSVALLILAACTAPATQATQPPDTTVPEIAVEVPFLTDWKGSGHADVAAEPFRHWDDATANPDGVPTSCAKCHTSAGYADFDWFRVE